MEIVELTEERWPALERLFGPNGAQIGCWCTFFLITNAESRGRTGDDNRELLFSRVCSGRPVGLLAMDGDEARGWVAVAPRLDYARLATTKAAAPVSADEDLSGIWSVTCFYIHRTARRKGLSGDLLAAAVAHARSSGAKVVEGYPVDTKGGKKSSRDLYHGTLDVFLDAGFTVAAERGPNRALVRKELG
ncbi:GNAT family N-acetyltransferase [Actinokineospora sp. HUAS TT18]|uniref:GNAT family N-acetyltransferase n=1 Tax=Actinokineospora sp. HUAS TT18 TaxID=3447451 RepID=UPI003F522A32